MTTTKPALTTSTVRAHNTRGRLIYHGVVIAIWRGSITEELHRCDHGHRTWDAAKLCAGAEADRRTY